jgi:hypothetical protein
LADSSLFSDELQSDARKGPQSVDNLLPISENPGDLNAFTLDRSWTGADIATERASPRHKRVRVPHQNPLAGAASLYFRRFSFKVHSPFTMRKPIHDIFHEALELPSDERHEFIVRSCAGDSTVVDKLNRLLRMADDDTDSRLAGPAAVSVRQFVEFDSDHAAGHDAPESIANAEIGPFRLVRLLGAGGMGAVYLAERKDGFRQQVALKLLRRDRIAYQSIVRHFEFERQVLSELRHDNVAQLYDGGSTVTGEPYFVME